MYTSRVDLFSIQSRNWSKQMVTAPLQWWTQKKANRTVHTYQVPYLLCGLRLRNPEVSNRKRRNDDSNGRTRTWRTDDSDGLTQKGRNDDERMDTKRTGGHTAIDTATRTCSLLMCNRYQWLARQMNWQALIVSVLGFQCPVQPQNFIFHAACGCYRMDGSSRTSLSCFHQQTVTCTADSHDRSLQQAATGWHMRRRITV